MSCPFLVRSSLRGGSRDWGGGEGIGEEGNGRGGERGRGEGKGRRRKKRKKGETALNPQVFMFR